jgi:hypothetical protein
MANNPNGLAAFSSRGPIAENRLKPDVVAPGTAILSIRFQNKKYLSSVNLTGVSEDPKYVLPIRHEHGHPHSSRNLRRHS